MSHTAFWEDLAGWLLAGAGAGHDEQGSARAGRRAARVVTERDTDSHEIEHAARDAELLARIRANDESALVELMRLYSSRLAGVAYALVENHDVAFDMVQDTFVAIWEQRATLGVQRNMAGYLYRAVRNRTVDWIRHERRQRAVAERAVRDDPTVRLVDVNAAEAQLAESDVARTLARVLEMVPERPRRVFLLSWHARLTYAEIAELLGIKVATVHQLMYRATTRLAELYRAEQTK